MSYFIFNNKDSRQFGILEALPLDIRAERVTHVIDMPTGVPIIYESDAYKAQTVTLNLGLRDNSVQNIMNINKWLTGRGNLIFSDDLDKYYDAVCNIPIIGERMIRHMGKIPIQFTVMPYRYARGNQWKTLSISQNWRSVILRSTDPEDREHYDDCTETLQPTFKIYANGFLDFNLQGVGSVQVKDVDEYCVVDVPNRRVYDKNKNSILNRTIGDFTKMEIKRGENVMYWSANTQKVEYLLHKRWL